MIPVNYHHLYYFWVTAKTGSITKAGEELLLAQPTLSLQLKQLEKVLGKALLERRRDGVALTSDGQTAFEHCERIFTQGDALLRALRDGKRTSAPVLRLGVAPSISRQITLRTLDAVTASSPHLKTTVFAGQNEELRTRLARHTLDLVITPSDVSVGLGKDFRSRLVGELPVSFVASPQFKRGLDGFPPKGQELPMLLRTPEHPLRKDIESYLARRRVKFHVVAESDDGYLLRILAAQGRGATGVNVLASRDDVSEGKLVTLNDEPTGLREFVWLISSVHPHPDPELREVIGSLMSRFRIKS